MLSVMYQLYLNKAGEKSKCFLIMQKQINSYCEIFISILILKETFSPDYEIKSVTLSDVVRILFTTGK